MPLPIGWPPRPASSVRSIRFYVTAAATADFADRAYLFIDDTAANTFRPTPYVPPGSTAKVSVSGDLVSGGSPAGGGADVHDVAPREHQNPPATQEAVPKAMIWSKAIRITITGAGDLEISFDGTNVQGYLVASSSVVYLDRHEAGIAVRGVGGATPTFHIEAW